MASSASLFTTYPIQEYLGDQQRWLEGRVTELKSVEEIDEKADDVIAKSIVGKLKLLRDQAEFTVTEGTTEVGVKLMIPLEGATRLLWTKPKTSGHPNNHVIVDDGGWLSDGGPSITLEHAFPGGTNAEDVRDWAKDIVDRIELALADLYVDIDAYNATVEAEVDRLLAQRRSVLTAGSTLRDGLGNGI